MRNALILSLATIAILSTPAVAMDIVPTYHDDTFHTWTAAEIAVVDRAIKEWEAAINMPGTVDIGFGWETGVSYGGVTYLWNWPSTAGADWHPWSGEIGHHIAFNHDAAWYVDPDPSTDEGFGGYDLLTAARHELGHALGNFAGFWFDDVYVTWYDRWEGQITGDTFDAGGLNVPMQPGDHGHLAGSSDLMSTTIWPGQREPVDERIRTMFNKAHGYTMYPDFNTDLLINGTDLSIMASGFGDTGLWKWSEGDANFDGVINGTDLSILASNFGFDGTASIPEPATMGLLTFGALTILRRRNR
jgi:hypothetical protein